MQIFLLFRLHNLSPVSYTHLASQGDRDAMRSLYMPGAVPEEHMERQIQENVDIWGKSQLDSFKKKGLNIRTSTKNGVKTCLLYTS